MPVEGYFRIFPRVEKEIGNAADRCRYDGNTGRERFDERVAESFDDRRGARRYRTS